MRMRVTFLGTGTSQGVPVIGCDCPVCTSEDPKDNRLRSSVLVETDNLVLVIDTGPDFRQQMLRSNVRKLDAVVFTHEHKDHIAGLDDVRAYNFLQKKSMNIYCTERVGQALKREFHYVFSGDPYPGIPRLELRYIGNQPFSINGVEILPIEVMHYKMPVLGFRIGDFSYITDAKNISNGEKKKIRGSSVLVLNALRKHDHISHFTLDEAVVMAKELEVRQTYFTHISHYLGKHADVNAELGQGMQCAFDRQMIELN